MFGKREVRRVVSAYLRNINIVSGRIPELNAERADVLRGLVEGKILERYLNHLAAISTIHSIVSERYMIGSAILRRKTDDRRRPIQETYSVQVIAHSERIIVGQSAGRQRLVADHNALISLEVDGSAYEFGRRFAPCANEALI